MILGVFVFVIGIVYILYSTGKLLTLKIHNRSKLNIYYKQTKHANSTNSNLSGLNDILYVLYSLLTIDKYIIYHMHISIKKLNPGKSKAVSLVAAKCTFPFVICCSWSYMRMQVRIYTYTYVGLNKNLQYYIVHYKITNYF